ELRAIFSELGVILVQLGPAIADFFARAAHVFKILMYLRFVMMAAIIVASVSMIEAWIGMSVITTVVLVEFFASALFPALVLAVIFVMVEVFVISQGRHCRDDSSGG